MPEPLTKQEQDYVMQLVLARPLGEVLPLYLKMTDQQLVPINGAGRPPMPQMPLPLSS